MNRRMLLKAGLVAVGAVCTGGAFESQPLPPGWRPEHVESDDPTWRLLGGTQWAINEERGVMTATFSETVRHMDGRDLSIDGFLMPLDARQRFTHFVLTRRNSSCPFCPPNEPTEAIEVFADTPLEFSPDPFIVTGRFHLIAESGDRLFYRFNPASVRAHG